MFIVVVLSIECDGKKDISVEIFKEVIDFIFNLIIDFEDYDWVVDIIERWC